MRLYQVAKILFSDTVHFIKAFKEVAVSDGNSKEEAEKLFKLLPAQLKFSTSFFNRLTKQWCYEFGKEFDRLPQNKILIGSEQFPPVENLYRGLRAAYKNLKQQELLIFLNRLGDPHKHLQVLAELSPLVRIAEGVIAEYEVAGFGAGNRKIDWRFVSGEGTPILLDVKYRVKDLVSHMSTMIPDIMSGERKFDVTCIEPDILFKDTVNKFVSRSSNVSLQGVWIHAHVKQEESKLKTYFASLDPEKLHFVILSRWRKDAYVLCRDLVDRDYLFSFFDLQHSSNFVY